ncbi:MAG TPA: DUF4013 domain-containing protein [Anaerolineales bacterium]|nr:DUF4013 domain-containing protein [Anaerolineales bacterium]
MDIGKSFSYQFEDKQWISKLGLGALITIVPILNFAWSGYMVGILRNVMNGAMEPLPNWDDLEKKFIDGLILFAVGIIYALPILLVVCLPLGFFAVSGVLSGSHNLQSLSNVIAGVGGVVFLSLLCLFILYGLALSIVYPAILLTFSREGTFASCFKFQDIFGIISKNPSAFFTAWLVSFLGGIVVSMVIGLVSAFVGWIPCVGWIVSFVLGIGTTVYISSVYAHIFGQFSAMTFGPNQPIQAV